MKPSLRFALGTLFLALAPLHATLDIVPESGDEAVLVLKNTETGKVLGTFWDRENDASDYGFESSIVPDFQWSADRAYVAVTAGASRSRAVSLYRVTGDSLKEIEVPSLTTAQSAEIDAIDAAASGTDAVRWQSDGTLLLKFWAEGEVHSDTETQKKAELWADVEVSGNTAKIVGTSTMEPSAPPAGAFPNPAPPAGETLASQQADAGQPAPAAGEEGFPAERLVGIHPVTGKNPDGSTYTGTVEVRVVNGIVGLEWKIGNSVSHGQGVLVGQTLGVALDDGLAIYRIVGQSEGQSLIGVWAVAGSNTPNQETILVGNADITKANFPTETLNGRYTAIRDVAGGPLCVPLTISGSDIAKKVLWKGEDGTATCQGLALGDGLAILTPNGLSVFEKRTEDGGYVSLPGRALSRDGEIENETLIPE